MTIRRLPAQLLAAALAVAVVTTLAWAQPAAPAKGGRVASPPPATAQAPAQPKAPATAAQAVGTPSKTSPKPSQAPAAPARSAGAAVKPAAKATGSAGETAHAAPAKHTSTSRPDATIPGANQTGLPPELYIPSSPSLVNQQQALEQILAAAAAQGKGKSGGIFDLVKNLFFGKPHQASVDVSTMVKDADAYRTTPVKVYGVLRQIKGKLYFAGQTKNYEIQMAGGVTPTGFPDKSLDWMPAVADGLVELPFGKPILHATSLEPSVSMAQLRLGRVLEVEGDAKQAVKAYRTASGQLAHDGLSWAAFAATHAGWLAYTELRNPKLAKGLLERAWTPYTKEEHGKPVYYTWTPKADGSGWTKASVATAVGPTLDAAGRNSILYRIVDLFVTVAGHSVPFGIILLGLVTRLVLHPLTVKQLRSSIAMQKLQPQIKALQEEFKDDKQRFQQEMWRVWQENGVNPFGGCWPMLIQMPLLFAAYDGIRDYIVQFSHASFLWVGNLALPDLPLLILYTISMVIFQQMSTKMQPMAMDDKQRQQQQMMTWMMPLMFFFFFRGLSSGFILYWLVSNLFYIGEYQIFKLQVARAEAHGVPVVAKPKRPSRFMEAMMKASQQAHPPKDGRQSDATEGGGSSSQPAARKPAGARAGGSAGGRASRDPARKSSGGGSRSKADKSSSRKRKGG